MPKPIPYRILVDNTEAENAVLADESGTEANLSGVLKAGASPPSAGNQLNMFFGVMMPCMLSIFGVILFMRLPFIVGESGLLGVIGLFVLGYLVVVLTTLSISAISTNGVVKGGGAYFMISRSLGAEFGGSIGTILFLAQVFATALYVIAFVEALDSAFGESGIYAQALPSSWWWIFLYRSITLMFCLFVCLIGAKVFAASSFLIFIVMMLAIAGVFLSFAIVQPFVDGTVTAYTSWKISTFLSNLLPEYAMPDPQSHQPQTWRTMFALLFPACTGIMAGANMSGDLRNPSKAIPKGTLMALLVTFVTYIVLAGCVSATIARSTLYQQYNVLETVSALPFLITAGIFCATLSSGLSSLIGASRIMQALARDNIIPVLRPFGRGVGKGDEPIFAVLLSWFLSQLILFTSDLNAVAPLVTMFFLTSYGITNLACLGPALSSAPNWRPTFRYFKWYTAALGVVLCFCGMFLVDPLYAASTSAFMAILFVFIAYTKPQTDWGDLSQALIYHQVRKYLLRLDARKDHVKYWRPQILLCVASLRSNACLVDFCNDLKKGGLYVLGHVLTGSFDEQIENLQKQQPVWLRFVDMAGIKAFVELTVASALRFGIQSLALMSGVGGMKPNIIVLGWADGNRSESRDVGGPVDVLMQAYSAKAQRLKTMPLLQSVNADLQAMRDANAETMSILDFVGTIKDVLSLRKTVGVARGFAKWQLGAAEGAEIDLTNSEGPIVAPTVSTLRGLLHRGPSLAIDVWPISFSGSSAAASAMLCMQLGTVLQSVRRFRNHSKLRILSFVEYRRDIEEKQQTMSKILTAMRIRARLRVVALEDCALREYDTLIEQGVCAVPVVSPPKNGGGSGTYDMASQRSDDMLITNPEDEEPLRRNVQHSDSPFENASAEVQMRIVNELMRKESGGVGVVFCTLPTPPDRQEDYVTWYKCVDVLSSQLPPTFLTHGTDKVVSTAL